MSTHKAGTGSGPAVLAGGGSLSENQAGGATAAGVEGQGSNFELLFEAAQEQQRLEGGSVPAPAGAARNVVLPAMQIGSMARMEIEMEHHHHPHHPHHSQQHGGQGHHQETTVNPQQLFGNGGMGQNQQQYHQGMDFHHGGSLIAQAGQQQQQQQQQQHHNLISSSSSSSAQQPLLPPVKKDVKVSNKQQVYAPAPSEDFYSQADPSLLPGGPNRNPRNRFSTDATERLFKLYHAGIEKPNRRLREELGRELGKTPRSIQIWFQNRRQKAKVPKQASGSGSPSLNSDNGTPSEPSTKDEPRVITIRRREKPLTRNQLAQQQLLLQKQQQEEQEGVDGQGHAESQEEQQQNDEVMESAQEQEDQDQEEEAGAKQQEEDGDGEWQGEDEDDESSSTTPMGASKGERSPVKSLKPSSRGGVSKKTSNHQGGLSKLNTKVNFQLVNSSVPQSAQLYKSPLRSPFTAPPSTAHFFPSEGFTTVNPTLLSGQPTNMDEEVGTFIKYSKNLTPSPPMRMASSPGRGEASPPRSHLSSTAHQESPLLLIAAASSSSTSPAFSFNGASIDEATFSSKHQGPEGFEDSSATLSNVTNGASGTYPAKGGAFSKLQTTSLYFGGHHDVPHSAMELRHDFNFPLGGSGSNSSFASRNNNASSNNNTSNNTASSSSAAASASMDFLPKMEVSTSSHHHHNHYMDAPLTAMPLMSNPSNPIFSFNTSSMSFESSHLGGGAGGSTATGSSNSHHAQQSHFEAISQKFNESLPDMSDIISDPSKFINWINNK